MLAQAREHARTRRADDVWPEQANQVFAQLMAGGARMMGSMGLGVDSPDGRAIHSLLLWAQREHRRAHHAGTGGSASPPFVYKLKGPSEPAATALLEPGRVGSQGMVATPAVGLASTVIAHEIVYEAQAQHDQPHRASRDPATPRRPLVDLSRHARRASLLEGLQLDNPKLDDDAWRSMGQPQFAAPVLRAVVDATPAKQAERAWQEGPRTEVKAAARAGDERAREAYGKHTLERDGLLPVAFRRAVADVG